MARTRKITPDIELADLVGCYYLNKQRENEYKKLSAEQNARIKELITSDKKYIKEDGKKQNERTFSADGFTVTYYEKVGKETFNEEALVDLLKDLGYTSVIKTKEYVDMEAFEDLLYKQQIKPEDYPKINKLRIPGQAVPTLTVKMDKKGV